MAGSVALAGVPAVEIDPTGSRRDLDAGACRGGPLPQALGLPLGFLHGGPAKGDEDSSDDAGKGRLAVGGLAAAQAPKDFPYLAGRVLGVRWRRGEGIGGRAA